MKRTLMGICTLTLLTACASPAIKDTDLIQQAALSQAQNSDQDPQVVIQSSRDLQISAQQADLYFFSPSYMAKAESEMALAEDALKLNKPASDIITHSLTAKTLFERGLAAKVAVESQLKPSLDGTAMLKEINAHVLLKDDFNDIEDDIKDLIVLIEQNKTQEALKDQKDVLEDITELEIDTLKTAFLTPAEKALEKAEDADAEEFAAVTFATAEKSVEKLELLIESKYKERQSITDHSLKTIRLAQHSEHVAKAAKPLLKLNAETAEQHVLSIEALLNRIGQALEHEPVNHLPLNNQSIALAQSVETLNKQAKTNQNNPRWALEKQEFENTISKLEGELATLSKTHKEQAKASNTNTGMSSKPASAESNSETKSQTGASEVVANIYSEPNKDKSETAATTATGNKKETLAEAAPLSETDTPLSTPKESSASESTTAASQNTDLASDKETTDNAALDNQTVNTETPQP